MAGKRIETMDLRQLISLKKQGISNRKVAQLLQISRNTVNGYTGIFENCGLSYDQLLDLDEFALKELCSPMSEVSPARYEALASQFEYFLMELKKPGCTLLTLWNEYRHKQADPYGYTQFTHHYNHWASKEEGSGKLNHKAGEKTFIDYTGKKLHWVDRHTGEVKPAEVFVGILPCSQYTYVEASESQQRDDLIGSMTRCVEYFGGATEAIVSDGLKSAVTKACKYEPVINKTFKDFALHYGCVVDPARPYSAQDKALVEGAVKLVYQRIFYPLSKMTFFSLVELNAAIRELLVKYNNYVFKLTKYSRRELFVSTEKQFLKPLPPTSYELRQYRRAKVQKMGYIFLSEDKHYYSVPYRFIGKHVEVRYTNSVVEIFYNHERFCTHKRDRQAGRYSTQKDHLSSNHKAYSEWSLAFFQRKAEHIGPKTVNYITKLVLQYSYPEIGYKQAMGIVQLTRLYPKDRIENACSRALTLQHCSFRIIDNMLRSGVDQLDLPLEVDNHIPAHDNIRGSSHYQ
jgi:transposase